jgi:hypothetical protein
MRMEVAFTFPSGLLSFMSGRSTSIHDKELGSVMVGRLHRHQERLFDWGRWWCLFPKSSLVTTFSRVSLLTKSHPHERHHHPKQRLSLEHDSMSGQEMMRKSCHVMHKTLECRRIITEKYMESASYIGVSWRGINFMQFMEVPANNCCLCLLIHHSLNLKYDSVEKRHDMDVNDPYHIQNSTIHFNNRRGNLYQYEMWYLCVRSQKDCKSWERKSTLLPY